MTQTVGVNNQQPNRKYSNVVGNTEPQKKDLLSNHEGGLFGAAESQLKDDKILKQVVNNGKEELRKFISDSDSKEITDLLNYFVIFINHFPNGPSKLNKEDGIGLQTFNQLNDMFGPILINDTAKNKAQLIKIIKFWMAKMADMMYCKDFKINDIHNIFYKFIKVFNYTGSTTLKKETYNYICNYLITELCKFDNAFSANDLTNRLKPLMLLIKIQRLVILSTLPSEITKNMLQRSTDNSLEEISEVERDIGAATDFLIRQEKLRLKSNQDRNNIARSPSYLDYLLQLYVIDFIMHCEEVNFLTSEKDIIRAQQALLLASSKELAVINIKPELHKPNGEKSCVEFNDIVLEEQDKLITEGLISKLARNDVTQLLSPVSEQELVYYGSIRVTPLVHNVLHFLNLLSKMQTVMQQIYNENIYNPVVLEGNNLKIIFEEYFERVKSKDAILFIDSDNDSKLPAETGSQEDTDKAIYELYNSFARKMDQTKPKNTDGSSADTNNNNQNSTSQNSLVMTLTKLFTQENKYPAPDILRLSKLLHDNMILFISKIK